MSWIFFAILTSAMFGLMLRYAQHAGRNMPWVGALNYTTAAAASWVFWAAAGFPPLNGFAVFFGTVAGFSFVAAYFLMVPCLRMAGVGITQAISQMSVVIPVVASMFLWGERPGCWRAIGLGLVLVAFTLLMGGKAVPHDLGGKSKFWMLLMYFVIQGIAGLLMKAYTQRVPGQEIVYMCFLYTSAAGVNLLAAACTSRADRRDAFHGVGLGLVNALFCFTFLRALGQAPGIVVFPTVSVGAILLTAFGAVLFWRERYRGRVLWGMAVAMLALICINAAR